MTPDPLSAATTAPGRSQAFEPAAVRNGSPAVKQAYAEALSFENVLVGQLCQQLAASAGLGGGASGQGDAGSSAGDPTASAYGSLLPGALSSAIMSGGGLGIANQLYPAIERASNAATGSSTGVA